LCDYKLIASPQAISTKGIKTTGGDFNNRELADSVDVVELAGNLIGVYKVYAIGKKCVVFAINCSHSMAIAARFRAAGIPAEHLDGETPDDERKAIIERFRTGETLVLCNVNIVTEGFNLPNIEAVQIARPTKSLSLWLQMVGRGLRPSEGKQHALILDHTDNFARLGMPDANHIWLLEGVTIAKEKLKRKRNNQIERDEELFEIVEAESITLQEVTAVDVEKLRLQEELKNLEKLFETAAHNRYKDAWVAFKFLESKPSLEALKVCAKRLGYKQGWAFVKFNEIVKPSQLGEVA
jgi:superfamily II DNA or RNA helicase